MSTWISEPLTSRLVSSEDAAMISRFNLAAMFAMAFLVVSTAEAQETSDVRAPVQTFTQLDLRIPDITELYTEEQIQALLAVTFQEHAEEVRVQGRREPVTPKAWPGIAAPFWAMLNPTQAWRIIAPLPPDQTRVSALNADVTTPYQAPAARTARDP